MANSTVIYSKHANCRILNSDSITNPYSNLLHVTSRRSTITGIRSQDNWQFSTDEIEQLYEKLAKIEEFERSKHLIDDLGNVTIAHIANIIEKKVITAAQFKCDSCKIIFSENTEKVQTAFLSSKFKQKPCRSTFSICQQAERFLKIQLLRGSINFNIVYHEILDGLNVDALYSQTDFSNHFDHKIYLIRYVAEEYIKIKAAYIAKMATLKCHTKQMRSSYHKLLHFYGQ